MNIPQQLRFDKLLSHIISRPYPCQEGCNCDVLATLLGYIILEDYEHFDCLYERFF